MNKSELWLMSNIFYKINHRQNEPNIKTACKLPIFIKTNPNQIN